MNAENPDGPSRNIKSKTYLIIAAVLLLVMAALSSIDASIVYILLGASVFFFFLFFQERRKLNPQGNTGNTGYESKRQTSTDKDLITKLRDSLESKSFGGPQQQNAGKVVAIISIFIGVVFFTIMVTVIFSNDASSSIDAMYYYQVGEQFRNNGQYDSADRYYIQALDADPENIEALIGYGNSLMAETRYDTAIDTFNRVINLDENNEQARYGKALTMHYEKNYTESLKESLSLMEVNPSNTDAIVLAGSNYYARNNYDSAIYWYEEGYGAGQRSAWLCHVMAYIYDTKGNRTKAVPLYQEALSYDSTIVTIYTRLSELFPGADGENYRMLEQKLKSEGYQ